ncbi:hypothetical protein D3C78_1631810 [compost metagenome]
MSRAGVRKAGAVGPVRMSFTPSASRVSRMTMAFCSNQESTRVSGRSLTPHSNASESARASWMAE